MTHERVGDAKWVKSEFITFAIGSYVSNKFHLICLSFRSGYTNYEVFQYNDRKDFLWKGSVRFA